MSYETVGIVQRHSIVAGSTPEFDDLSLEAILTEGRQQEAPYLPGLSRGFLRAN